MERCVRAQADIEYRNDGGRNRSSNDHPRTTDQRGFDAAHTLLTGQSASDNDANNDDPNATGSRPERATTDQLTGIDPSVITTADGKPLPASVVEELSCGADYIAQIFSTTGELLWQGRKKRLATPAQINGLIARDGGCVPAARSAR